MFAALLAAALEDEFEVVIGHNGRQGLALCLGGGVAAVVTDIGMPEFDGIQMLAEFEKKPPLSGIPVIVVTATHFTRLHREAVSRFPQVRLILSKAESVDTLASAVKAVLRAPGA